MGEDGMADEVLDPAERATLADQLKRLNENLERQFELIEVQRQEGEKVNRRRWRIALVLVLMIGAGMVRVEFLRSEQRASDKRIVAAQRRADEAEQRVQELRQCRRSNAARTEIRSAIDMTLQAVRGVAAPDQQATVDRLAQEVHDKLAESLPEVPCSSSEPFTSCVDARAAGATPLHRGDPGYSSNLDQDGDGIACE